MYDFQLPPEKPSSSDKNILVREKGLVVEIKPIIK
jgi:hypothetical protein